MRTLKAEELLTVSGGCGEFAGDFFVPCPEEPVDPIKQKGNNGFGNGGADGVPGGSDHQDVTR